MKGWINKKVENNDINNKKIGKNSKDQRLSVSKGYVSRSV